MIEIEPSKHIGMNVAFPDGSFGTWAPDFSYCYTRGGRLSQDETLAKMLDWSPLFRGNGTPKEVLDKIESDYRARRLLMRSLPKPKCRR